MNEAALQRTNRQQEALSDSKKTCLLAYYRRGMQHGFRVNFLAPNLSNSSTM